MKVKVGDKIWDGAEQLVMIILSPSDKWNISNMLPDCTRYCQGPEETTEKEFQEFMEVKE
jgi:hypothetical protein